MSTATLIAAGDAIFTAGFVLGLQFRKACAGPPPRKKSPAPETGRLPHANPLDDLVATVARKETAK